MHCSDRFYGASYLLPYIEGSSGAKERTNERRKELKKAKKKAYATEMAIDKAFFKIVGMYCTNCKPIVEKQLKDDPSFKKIEIDYMTNSIIVDFDATSISKEEIKERLEKSFYKFVRVAR